MLVETPNQTHSNDICKQQQINWWNEYNCLIIQILLNEIVIHQNSFIALTQPFISKIDA